MSGFDLYEVTGGMSPDEIGDALRLPNLAACRKLSFDKPVRIAVMGASIMNGAFGTSSRRSIFKNAMNDRGVAVLDVTEYTVGGHKSTNTAAITATVIADYAGYEEQTVVILHTGGNDITASGPYPGGATTLDTNYRQIISDLNTAGIAVFPCSITYRIPPASKPSYPYNENIIIPAIKDLKPEAMRLSGRPIIDLYGYTMATEGLHDADGVHYTSAGYDAIAEFIGNNLPDGIENPDAISDYINDVIIDFGELGSATTVDFGVIPGGDAPNNTSSVFCDSNGKLVKDLTVTAIGFVSGDTTSGKDYSGTGYSLDRAEITKDSIFLSSPSFGGYSGDIGSIKFSGESIEHNATYNVTVVASKNTAPATDNLRWGVYTCGGQSLELNAADSTNTSPNTITFTGVSGDQLLSSGITVVRRDPELDSFAYVGGIQIVKTS